MQPGEIKITLRGAGFDIYNVPPSIMNFITETFDHSENGDFSFAIRQENYESFRGALINSTGIQFDELSSNWETREVVLIKGDQHPRTQGRTTPPPSRPAAEREEQDERDERDERDEAPALRPTVQRAPTPEAQETQAPRTLNVSPTHQDYVYPEIPGNCAPVNAQRGQCNRCGNIRCDQHHSRRVRYHDVQANGHISTALRGPKFDRVDQRTEVPIEQVNRRIYDLVSEESRRNASGLDELIRQSQSLQAKLVQIQRQIHRINVDIETNPVVQQVAEQLRRLRETRNNKIENAFMTNEFLVIQTENLYASCNHDHRERDIGKMEFLIPLETLVKERFLTSFITIRNRTREVVIGNATGGLQAPHTGAGGGSCFGNITNTLVELLVRHDIISLVDHLIRFIEQPNEADSMGVRVRHWPFRQQNEAAEQQQDENTEGSNNA